MKYMDLNICLRASKFGVCHIMLSSYRSGKNVGTDTIAGPMWISLTLVEFGCPFKGRVAND